VTTRGTYTEAEVAERLGKSQSTVRRWAAEGKLPVINIPGTRRIYPANAIDRLVGEGTLEQVAS
jgi:excisionase family DNA binding protein